MGISRAYALKQYVPELRRLEAAEYEIPEDEWVEAKLRTDWLVSEMQDRMKSHQPPEDIGRFLGEQIDGEGPMLWTGSREDLALLETFMDMAAPPSPPQS